MSAISGEVYKETAGFKMLDAGCKAVRELAAEYPPWHDIHTMTDDMVLALVLKVQVAGENAKMEHDKEMRDDGTEAG